MGLLVLHADKHTCLSYPSLDRLKDMTGYDPGNIMAITRSLITKSYISQMEDGTWKIEVMFPEKKPEDENPYKHFQSVGDNSTIRTKTGQWIMPVDQMYANLPPSNAELTREERMRKMNARYRKGGEKP